MLSLISYMYMIDENRNYMALVFVYFVYAL